MTSWKSELEWQEDATCWREANLSPTDAFDVFQQHTDAKTGKQREKAEKRCTACPVFEECLTWWAKWPESWREPSMIAGGLWGPSTTTPQPDVDQLFEDEAHRRPVTPDGQPDLEAALDLARSLRAGIVLGAVG